MTISKIVHALKSGDVDHIDALQDDALLFEAILACERKSKGCLPESVARTLDMAYAVRLLDLAQPGTQAIEAMQFANHLYKVAHDKRREHLDAMDLRFFSRWRGYADVAVLLMQLRKEAAKEAEVNIDVDGISKALKILVEKWKKG